MDDRVYWMDNYGFERIIQGFESFCRKILIEMIPFGFDEHCGKFKGSDYNLEWNCKRQISHLFNFLRVEKKKFEGCEYIKVIHINQGKF